MINYKDAIKQDKKLGVLGDNFTNLSLRSKITSPKSNSSTCKMLPLVFGIAVSFNTTVAAPQYQFVDLGTLGGENSAATALNDKRQIVGWSTSSEESDCLGTGGLQPCRQGFVWNQSELTAIKGLSDSIDQLIPAAINHSGIIVGKQHDYRQETNQIESHTLPIKWQQGYTELLPIPKGSIGAALDVNAHGEIIGWYQHEGKTQRIALWGDNQQLDILPDEHLSRRGIAINSSGWIAGWEYEPRSLLPNQAFLINHQHLSLGSGVNLWSESVAINDYGVIAGNLSIKPHRPGKATLWYRTVLGTYHQEILGSSNSGFLDVNNQGDAVGYQLLETTTFQKSYALVYLDSTLYDLNELVDIDVHLAQATAINDNGDIVGYYHTPEGHQRAFALFIL